MQTATSGSEYDVEANNTSNHDEETLIKNENEKLTINQTTKSLKLKNRQDILNARAAFQGDRLLGISTVIIMGILFGFFMNKGRVFDPFVIRDQFKFKRWIMFKMFCAAGGTSCFGLTIGRFICRDCWECTRAKYRGVTNIWSTLLGTFILGIGMSLCGGCPGMVWIQLGAGTHNALWAIFGCFIGATIFGFLHPFISSYLATQHLPEFIDEYLKISYHYLTISCGILFFIVVTILEILFPWKSELTSYERLADNNCNFFDCIGWNPSACGVGVGLLQLPCIFILGNTLGGSSAYTALISQWLHLPFVSENIKNKFCHFNSQLNRWWQVFYVMIAAIGSFFATVGVIGWKYGDAKGIDPIAAFMGGFLMLFGSRCAKGCTSGHGLSGTALMVPASFIGVAGMFLGGGLTMLVIKI